MCLLFAIDRMRSDSPLVIGANRDEMLSRPSTAMTVLASGEPRILGGRDQVAGGTWLAVNEHGLVAAVTNRRGAPPDAEKRSRGEWPLFLAKYPSAAIAVAAFCAHFRPTEFNPGWLLVGDGNELFYIDMSGSKARHRRLEPGIHVLENRPFGVESPKVDLVSSRLSGHREHQGRPLIDFLAGILSSHDLPQGIETDSDWIAGRAPATQAACVHAGEYGTRSSIILQIQPQVEPPDLWSAAGPPCTAAYRQLTDLWRPLG